ncbi:uncharacterized protein P174DRAFT_425355 [Aspergillus novofumigatus IBT 16806]|uniref:Zn(2)-C6 fungal-type domain-containing protein n=1 Tax=Aspergillus novofumigatus (strain IBT 16806) TaxID=1392255 RepID=A0A2I1BVL5_ASPN1|nr:uncharacterized protein P174DRAFT_425355 [Aspergillus novofumigatus IBT 16806]PKX89432.1 hypothetical protein P174DRAFT_425355 [Aspergillus novofumigatus IBT 16806]
MAKAHILVIGATGPSGLEFCNAALLQGHTLTLYVRSPEKLPNEIRNSVNVSVVKGTLEDIASFQRAATSGPTVFVSFAGPVSKSKGTPVTDAMKRIFPILVESHYDRAMVLGTCSYPAPQDKGGLKWKASVVLIKIIGGSAYDEFRGLGEFVASQDVSQLKCTLFRVPFLTNGPNAPVTASYTGTGDDGVMVNPWTSDKSRQKSCNACVRSKRRCDKRTPQCTRCAERGLSCLYHKNPAASGSDNSTTHAVDVDFGDLIIVPDEPSIIPGAEFEFGSPSVHGPPLIQELFPSSAADAENPQMPLVGPTPSFDLSFLNFDNLTDYMTGTPQPFDMQPWHGLAIQDQTSMTAISRISGSPLHANYRVSIDEGRDVSEDFQPWRLYQSESKIGLMTKSIKEIPGVFVRTKEAPFLHRHLYRQNIPRSIITLYAAVSAYAAHNDSNRDWALRVLSEGVDDLLAVPKEAAHSRHHHETTQSHESTTTTAAHAQAQGPADVGTGATNTVYEKLANTQALWMYQVLRVFDGDIGLRSQAERDMTTLEAWLLELEQYRDNLAEMCLLEEAEVRQRAPASWESWIFNESLRRTILMGYSFIAFYALLKWSGCKDTNMPDPGHFVRVHRWTASGSLWRADSSPTFFLAWHRQRQTFVQNFFIEDFAKVAKPVDVDPLSWIMLAA